MSERPSRGSNEQGSPNNMNYIIVDTANTFFRARHVVRGDADIKIGMALHVTLASIKKAWQDFNGSHVVFCLEGRSWRKDFYAPYKRNRSEARAALNEKEAEEDKLFWETFDKFKEFIIEKTNLGYEVRDNIPDLVLHFSLYSFYNST